MKIGQAERRSKLERSEVMRRVRSVDTQPERRVRRALQGLGLRCRANVRALPGTPDIVLTRAKAAILVHGCFWHQHCCPRGARRPATNRKYWDAKLDRNVRRDRQRLRELRTAGWRCLVLWECQIRDDIRLERRLRAFLRSELLTG